MRTNGPGARLRVSGIYLTRRLPTGVRWNWFLKPVSRLRRIEARVRDDWDSMDDAARLHYRMIASAAETRTPTARERFEMRLDDLKVAAGMLFSREETVEYLRLTATVIDMMSARVAADVWSEAEGDEDFERATAIGREEIRQGKTVVAFDSDRLSAVPSRICRHRSAGVSGGGRSRARHGPIP